MSFPNNSFGEEERVAYMGTQGYSQGRTIGFEYPDPSSLGTQASINNGSTSSGYIQQDAGTSFGGGGRWPLSSRGLNQMLAGLDPVPFSGANWTSGIPEGSSHDQLLSEPIQQTTWGNQHSAPTFPEANFRSRTTNNVASEEQLIHNTTQNFIYNPTQNFIYNYTQNVYHPDGPALEHYGQPFQPWAPDANAAQHPSSIFMQQHPLVPAAGQGMAHHDRLQRLQPTIDPSATQSQPSEAKRRSLRPRLHLSGPSSAANTVAAGKGSKVSKRAQKKAILGDKMGDDGKEKAPVRTAGGNLYGLVDGKWERAGYHRQFRRQLIQMDAQQPGAPDWQEGMSENYTSYSPVTRDWTADRKTVKDSKGRLVHFLSTRPADLIRNDGYLTCEGLVMLDHNNRPIPAFEGAPRTLATSLPSWFIESLRRAFGMTYWDLRARMPAKYITKGGVTRALKGHTALSNLAGSWVRDMGMSVWHHRAKGKADGHTQG